MDTVAAHTRVCAGLPLTSSRHKCSPGSMHTIWHVLRHMHLYRYVPTMWCRHGDGLDSPSLTDLLIKFEAGFSCITYNCSHYLALYRTGIRYRFGGWMPASAEAPLMNACLNGIPLGQALRFSAYTLIAAFEKEGVMQERLWQRSLLWMMILRYRSGRRSDASEPNHTSTRIVSLF